MRQPTRERFYSKVIKTDGCWLWTSARTTRGYGHFWFNGRPRHAHRIAWMLERGAIPDELVIDHLCRTPLCVNTAHMELVSNRENILRGIGPSAQNAVKTHCVHGHPLDDSNTYRYRGNRMCLACLKTRTVSEKTRAERVSKHPNCRNGHPFSPENTYLNPLGARVCRICKRASGIRRHGQKRKTS